MNLIGEYRRLRTDGQPSPVEGPANFSSCGHLERVLGMMVLDGQIKTDMKDRIFNDCFNGAWLPGEEIITIQDITA